MPLEEILRDISVDNAWAHIERITEQIPGRLAGSPNSRRMAEYAHDTFTRAGLASQMHEFLGLYDTWWHNALSFADIAVEQKTYSGEMTGPG